MPVFTGAWRGRALGAAAALFTAAVQGQSWQPAAGATQTAIWPQPVPGPGRVSISKDPVGEVARVTNVTRPTA